jgi:Putative zinc-finger
MGPHEEFLELCAAATAGELSAAERGRLDAHLAGCPDCRRAMKEYEVATETVIPALAPELARNQTFADSSWSVEDAEWELFKRLDREQHGSAAERVQSPIDERKLGQRFTYHPSQIRWREMWMPFAAMVFLTLALGIVLYRTGLQRGIDLARTQASALKGGDGSVDARTGDAADEPARLMAKLAESDRIIGDLKRQLSEETSAVSGLKSASLAAGRAKGSHPHPGHGVSDSGKDRDEELASEQARMADIQKALDAVNAEATEAANQVEALQAKVNELTQLARDREQALDQREREGAKQQELLEHDRDIRELMGARELYMADVHDVSREGTNKTHGRVFYTKGKSLIFYAFDLDAQPGVQDTSSFQAWGRRGADKRQALSLGIFYEDNVSKKRWVLKADDPKTLQDIDAVFVTSEPSGGSLHPSGRQLLFAYLRVSPNHP